MKKLDLEKIIERLAKPYDSTDKRYFILELNGDEYHIFLLPGAFCQIEKNYSICRNKDKNKGIGGTPKSIYDSYKKIIKNERNNIFFLAAGGQSCEENYVVSYELLTKQFNGPENNVFTIAPLETIKKNLQSKPDFFRIKANARGWEGYAVFIKIPTVDTVVNEKTIQLYDKGPIYDVTNLLNYFICSDSRTYKDVVYYPVYKSMTSSNESENEVLPHNLLIYGAPGTGKSFYVNKEFEKKILSKVENYTPFSSIRETISEETFKALTDAYEKEFGIRIDFKANENSSQTVNIKISKAQNDFINKYLTRVTFYEDYSYESFVGCYKPIKKTDETTGEEKLTYEFEPGPFINIYVKAIKDKAHPYLLAIEEINRAKAAAVFGDLFQVLDRNDEGNSEYGVNPETALDKYLSETLCELYNGTISLPSNLYI